MIYVLLYFMREYIPPPRLHLSFLSFLLNSALSVLSIGILRGINDPLCKSLVLGLTPSGMEGSAAGAFVLTSSLGRALGPSVVALSELCV